MISLNSEIRKKDTDLKIEVFEEKDNKEENVLLGSVLVDLIILEDQ